jgi:hypothetical protein
VVRELVGVLSSGPLEVFAVAYLASSEEYCGP